MWGSGDHDGSLWGMGSGGCMRPLWGYRGGCGGEEWWLWGVHFGGEGVVTGRPQLGSGGCVGGGVVGCGTPL